MGEVRWKGGQVFKGQRWLGEGEGEGSISKVAGMVCGFVGLPVMHGQWWEKTEDCIYNLLWCFLNIYSYCKFHLQFFECFTS